MLHITDRQLSVEAAAFLDRMQSSVDREATRSDQIDAAKTLFDMRHRVAYRRHFLPITELLSEMAPPYRRCYYCEDSEHRDLEHIRPKRHYPELCFRWANYAFACSICNGAKSDKVGLFLGQDEAITVINRSHPKSRNLPLGESALINPRTEDPLDFLKLDLLTGNLLPLHHSGRAHARARHTIDLLRLNRDAIRRNRVSMIKACITYLELYKNSIEKMDGKDRRILAEITKLPQPTVFAELKRQRLDYPEVDALLSLLP